MKGFEAITGLVADTVTDAFNGTPDVDGPSYKKIFKYMHIYTMFFFSLHKVFTKENKYKI